MDNFKKQNLKTEHTASLLTIETIENPKTAKFYTSLKIQKQGNPGRLGDDTINSHTSNLSKFVDHYFQTHVKSIQNGLADFNYLLL